MQTDSKKTLFFKIQTKLTTETQTRLCLSSELRAYSSLNLSYYLKMKVIIILYFPCMAITNLTQTGLHLS